MEAFLRATEVDRLETAGRARQGSGPFGRCLGAARDCAAVLRMGARPHPAQLRFSAQPGDVCRLRKFSPRARAIAMRRAICSRRSCARMESRPDSVTSGSASTKRAPRIRLHGLNAVHLPEFGWYRIDPRGNKPGVDAQFSPPVERLAFPVVFPEERLFPEILADPCRSSLQRCGRIRRGTRCIATCPIGSRLPSPMPELPEVEAVAAAAQGHC